MEPTILYKIKSEQKYYDYLRSHSYWYKYLNRDPDNFKYFLESYKKYNREKNTNKVNDTINNMDMVANILKVLE